MNTLKGVTLPDDFAAALAAHPPLRPVLERMRPSCQKDYVAWIDAAQEDGVRQQRIDRVIQKIARWGARHP